MSGGDRDSDAFEILRMKSKSLQKRKRTNDLGRCAWAQFATTLWCLVQRDLVYVAQRSVEGVKPLLGLAMRTRSGRAKYPGLQEAPAASRAKANAVVACIRGADDGAAV